MILLGICLSSGSAAPRDTGEKDYTARHKAMVELLRTYGIKDERILAAMAKIQRHRFIPPDHLNLADSYGDHPCPIGFGQTISQPFIVAYMTECLTIKKGEKVLEIGTGSGYQAAVIAELGAEVFSIEIIPELAEHARKVLQKENYTNVWVLAGDGYKGWPEHAPFDAVIVTCAPDEVPKTLVDQLKDGGRMILPVGSIVQRLVILKKSNGKIERANDIPVRFVPMIHK